MSTKPQAASAKAEKSEPAKPKTRNWCADLEHRDWELRFLAAKRLGTEPGIALIEALSPRDRKILETRLVALLDDPEAQVRSAAAQSIGHVGLVSASDALVAALADPNEWVRVQVADALGHVGNPKVAQVIANHLETEREPHVRATIVKSLGAIGDERMLPVLALLLDDPDNRVRANTVEALVHLQTRKGDLKKILGKLANDPSNRVRANAALALLAEGDKKGREILEAMIKLKDEFMRASALYALGELKMKIDQRLIVKHFDDASWLVRKNAVRAMIKHGKAGLPAVITALRSPHPHVKLAALEVVATLRDPGTRSSIIALLEDESGEVRNKAEEILDLLDGY